MSGFKKAVKTDRMLRLALVGTTGSGKTYTALRVARGIAEEMGGGLVGLIDSERESASLYADEFDFITAPIRTGNPNEYIDRINEAKREGVDVLVIDSMSHAWIGQEGALRLVDQAAAKTQSKNTFAAWRTVTPQHDAFVGAVLDYPGTSSRRCASRWPTSFKRTNEARRNRSRSGCSPSSGTASSTNSISSATSISRMSFASRRPATGASTGP